MISTTCTTSVLSKYKIAKDIIVLPKNKSACSIQKVKGVMLANRNDIVIETRPYVVWFEWSIIPTDIQTSIITIVYGNY